MLDSLCNAPETQPIMCRRIGIVFRRKGKQLKERELSQDDSDSGRNNKALVLHFYGFSEGIKWIFPHALERELEDLWNHVNYKQKGYVSFESMMRRIIREERSRSPQPGPTHYNPQFTIVEPKPIAAVILPETVEAEQIVGLPSELFMDYDTFKAVKPRTTAAIFPKRKFDASWCNPVVREPVDGYLDECADDAEGNSFQTPRGANKLKPPSSQQSVGKPITPRPPRPRQSFQDSSSSGGRPKGSVTFSRPQEKRSFKSSLGSGGMSEDGVAAQNNSKESLGRSPRGADRAQPQHSYAAAAPVSRTTNFGAMNPSSGQNLFYNDIAPLYLKFLNSKEVQKFMKQ